MLIFWYVYTCDSSHILLPLLLFMFRICFAYHIQNSLTSNCFTISTNLFYLILAERPTNEKESVFHAKPVKVKRSPPVLTQTDEGGIFSANNKPEHADEVKEDENTKIDLPVDQVRL